MLLGFKTELKLNNKQRTTLLKHAGTARHAWNKGLAATLEILDYNKANPDKRLKFPSAIDLHKWLVAAVKPNNPWYYEVSKCAPQYALRQLREAWDRAFKKVSKSPKFKKKVYSKNTFTLDGAIKLDHFKVYAPKIGWLRTFEQLPQGVNPKYLTISRQAYKWFISFKVETGIKESQKSINIVGVDLGVLSLATLSTGEVYTGAKSYKTNERKLSRLQWLSRNKVVGSSNWKKTRHKVARIHMKIANIRKDTLHKLTTYLAKNHGRIVIEDLNVSGMMANHKLAKAISDMGFYEFRQQLEYKTKMYASELIITDSWFPSSKTCNNCGQVKTSLSLSERTFTCDCGYEGDRDLNAAKNLAALAVSPTVTACGLGDADISRLKQEETILLARVSAC